jgi:hypothetical protein
MYFDAVIDNESGNVLFNGTPSETEEFLLGRNVESDDQIYVMDGYSLRSFTPKEYLSKI